MADTVEGTTGKISSSFKKHKVLWALAAIAGVVVIYFLIKFYTNPSSGGSASNSSSVPLGTGGTGFSGASPVDVTGVQGPPGPPGKRGPRGPKGPPGKPPKKHHHHNNAATNVTMPPMHMIPQHTSGAAAFPHDVSHAVKSP